MIRLFRVEAATGQDYVVLWVDSIKDARKDAKQLKEAFYDRIYLDQVMVKGKAQILQLLNLATARRAAVEQVFDLEPKKI